MEVLKKITKDPETICIIAWETLTKEKNLNTWDMLWEIETPYCKL